MYGQGEKKSSKMRRFGRERVGSCFDERIESHREDKGSVGVHGQERSCTSEKIQP